MLGSDLENRPPDVDYHKGTRALEFHFLDQMPPSTLYENSDFEIWLELMNNGASDIRDGYITFSGFQSKYVGLEKTEHQFDLDGKSLYSPNGEKTYLELSGETHEVHDSLDAIEVPLTVNACYRYFTYFSGDLCLSSGKPQAVSRPSCTNENLVTVSGGQGGPLAVQGIDVETIPSRTMITYVFTIAIRNSGSGDVRHPQAYQKDCVGPALSSDEVDVFTMQATIGNDQTLECTQDGNELDDEGIYKLPSAFTESEDAKSHDIICRYRTESDFQSYKTKLNLRLEYGYVQSDTHTMTIKQYDA
jgi:hypothetical protein